jgi:hypothetical protein
MGGYRAILAVVAALLAARPVHVDLMRVAPAQAPVRQEAPPYICTSAGVGGSAEQEGDKVGTEEEGSMLSFFHWSAFLPSHAPGFPSSAVVFLTARL